LRENCLGDQSEPEVFAGKYLVPVNKSETKPAPKRKQSLRALFGAGFLDKDEEATEIERQNLLPLQRNALEPLSDCIRNLPDTKQLSTAICWWIVMVLVQLTLKKATLQIRRLSAVNSLVIVMMHV
jgi:hypothetical protein